MDPDAEVERHPKFYIPSGDVVLALKVISQAGDGSTNGPPRYQLFRVHKFLLGLRSSVFSSLFADADPAVPDASYDGVALVELPGDDVEDFALLLSYLYEPEISLTFRRRDPNTPIAISGVLRLTDKYFIEPLQKRLLKQVCDDWPTTLLDRDIQRGEIMAVTSSSVLPPSGHRVLEPFSDLVPEPASAIVFAQEFGCPEILPVAFYSLLSIDIKDDWSLRDSADSSSSSSFRLARWNLLDKDNLMRYLHGLREVDNYDPHLKAFMSDDCWPYDTESQATGTPCLRYVRCMVSGAREGRDRRDPLLWLANLTEHDLFPYLSTKYFPKGLCTDCRDVLYRAVPKERQRIWHELPKWFKLDPGPVDGDVHPSDPGAGGGPRPMGRIPRPPRRCHGRP